VKPAKFQIVKFDPGAAKFIGFAKQQCQRLIDNGTEDFYRFWNMGGGVTIKARSYCGSVKLWLEASLGSWIIGESNISPSGTQTEYYYPTTTAKYDSVANSMALTEATLSKSLVFNYLPLWLGMPNDVGKCYVWLANNALYGADYTLNPTTGNYDITVTIAQVSDSSKVIAYTLPESVVYGTVDPTSPGANVSISVDSIMLAGRATIIVTPDGITSYVGPGTPILWDVASGVLRSSPELAGGAPLNAFKGNQYGTVTANYYWSSGLNIRAVRFNTVTNSFEVIQYTPPAAFTSAVRLDTNASKEAVNFRFYADSTAVYYEHITDAQVETSTVITIADMNTFFAAGLIAYGIANSIPTPSITSVQPASSGTAGFGAAAPAGLTPTGFFDVLACSWSGASGVIIVGVTQSGHVDIFNFNGTGVMEVTGFGSSGTFGVANGYWYGVFDIAAAYVTKLFDLSGNIVASLSGDSAGFATPTGIYLAGSQVYRFALASSASLPLVAAPSTVIATPDVDILVCLVSGTYTIYGYYPDGTFVTLGTCAAVTGTTPAKNYYHPKSRMLFIDRLAIVMNVGKKTSMLLVTDLSFLPATLGSSPNFNPYYAYLPTYYPAQSDWAADWVAQAAALQPP